MIWTKAFWKGLGERAIKTFAQAGVAAAGVGVVGNATGITDINWLQVVSIASLATILSALTSIGNASFTAGDSAIAPPVTISKSSPTGTNAPSALADPDRVTIQGGSQ